MEAPRWERQVPGMTVGEGSAEVAVAGTGVEGGGVSCPLPHAAKEEQRNRMRIRRIMDQLWISRVSASMISPNCRNHSPPMRRDAPARPLVDKAQ